MKQLLLLICLVAGMAAGAQKAIDNLPHDENFKAENGDIVWQKAYPTKLDFKDLSANVKMAGIFVERPDVDDPVIAGELKPIETLFKEIGYRWANTHIYQSGSKVAGFVAMKYMKDSILVQVKKMYFVPLTSGGLLKTGDKLSDLWLTKKGELDKRYFVGKVAHVYDYTFTKLFDPLFK